MNKITSQSNHINQSGPAGHKTGSKGLLAALKKSRTAYIMLIPVFVCLCVFGYYPPVMSMVYSFFDVSTTGSAFVGFANYIELFRDTVFLNSLLTLVKLTVPRMIISIVVPFVFAEMIFAVKHPKLKYAFRVLIVLPLVTPGIVNSYLWKFIYEPNNGLLNNLLSPFGVSNVDWLDSQHVIGSIVFMGFPWIAGSAVLIYLAGLMAIPESIFESCKLEGCSIWRRIFVFDIPLIKGQFKFFVITSFIALMQEYGTQLIITGGGPGYTTWVPGWHLYQMAFVHDRMGYASAIGVVMFVVLMLFTVSIRKFVKTEDDN